MPGAASSLGHRGCIAKMRPNWRMTLMLKLLATLALSIVALSFATPSHAEQAATAMSGAQAGRLTVNGVDYYYEIAGKGEPLLILHGGLGSIDMFAPVLPILLEDRQVVAVDLHGHGRTGLGDRSIVMADIGADLAALVEQLGYEEIDVMGYSFGAWAGLHMAAHDPDLVRRLVLTSMPYARDGFFPEMLPQQAQLSAAAAEFMKDTPMYKSYMALAPEPAAFPDLLDEMGNLMRTPYDYAAQIEKLNMPVMLIYGDSDMIRPEHIVDLYQKLGGGLKDAGWQREHMATNRLAILPDLTHYEMFLAPVTARTARRFLDGQSGVGSWAEQVGGN